MNNDFEISTASLSASEKKLTGYVVKWNNLELYCVNYAIYRKAVVDLDIRGFSIVNSQGSESRNPSLSAKADAEKIMIKMSSLLGFDPVSRRKNPVETEEEDELARL
ncbi:P27 family phage terminase small subunit [Xenorhabdus bovienii]|uniref:P27 family phage terminase small subunit n=1 Tax=Xenorhabdus bovienii TaxID=40576 RepID=UPI003DA4298F